MIKKVSIGLFILVLYSYAMAEDIIQIYDNPDSKNVAVISYDKLSPEIKYLPLQSVKNNFALDSLKSSRHIVMSSEKYENLPVVIGGDNRNQVRFSLGDTIYLKNYNGALDSKLIFISKFRDLIDPDTKESLGTEYSINATGLVSNYLSDVASVELMSVNDQVSIGDKVITTDDITLVKTMQYTSNNFIIGKIIAIHDSVLSTAMMNYVVINKGARDGVKVGVSLDVMENKLLKDPTSINSDSHDLILPEQILGEILIYSVYEKVSFGMIMSSHKEIPLYAEVKSRRYE